MAGNGNKGELISIVKKYLEGKASDQEILFLEKYYNYFEQEPGVIATLSETEKEVLEKEILQALQKKIKGEATIVPFYNNKWFRVAASVAIILSLLGYFYFRNQQPKQVAEINNERKLENDIKPGGNKAILTLGDNTQIILDSAQIGTLAQQGNTKVLKLSDGQIIYNASGKAIEIVYNTITTPKRGQYQLTLSDGSRVWLNAASSITYPIVFTGNERKVTVTGEVFFSVVHNAKMPFKVMANETEIEDMGTEFNVNAYSDESSITTTLLEGAVKVTKGDNTIKLMPNQQSVLNKNGSFTLNKDVNTDEIVAWKNGYFHFESADLKTILRQFARWYDIEIIYEGAVTDRKFFGIVKRSNTLKKVLEMLQDNNIVYQIEGKKLIVKSS